MEFTFTGAAQKPRNYSTDKATKKLTLGYIAEALQPVSINFFWSTNQLVILGLDACIDADDKYDWLLVKIDRKKFKKNSKKIKKNSQKFAGPVDRTILRSINGSGCSLRKITKYFPSNQIENLNKKAFVEFTNLRILWKTKRRVKK